MKPLTAIACAMTLCAGTALAQDAQDAPDPGPPPPGQGDSMQPPPPPPPPPPPQARDDRGPGPGGPDRRGGARMHRGGPHDGAASVSIDTGRAKIRVHCGQDQSSRSCMDMIMELLDRVQDTGGNDARPRRDRDRDSGWDDDGGRDRYDDGDRRD